MRQRIIVVTSIKLDQILRIQVQVLRILVPLLVVLLATVLLLVLPLKEGEVLHEVLIPNPALDRALALDRVLVLDLPLILMADLLLDIIAVIEAVPMIEGTALEMEIKFMRQTRIFRVIKGL